MIAISGEPAPDSSILPSWRTRSTRVVGAVPLIDYVLLAEFDIDTGSTLRHQYPAAIPGNKADWFAEHMLPEGAHNRTTDYTYIFLNRQGTIVDESNIDQPLDNNKTGNTTTSTGSINTTDVENSKSECFLFGLNCVKTKHDSSVRRGAIVKSMCIFTRYSFVESLKIALEQALENYFQNQSISVLEELYESLNAVSLDHLPKPNMVELLLMRRGVSYDHLRTPCQDHLPTAWNRNIALKKDLSLSIPVYRTVDEVGPLNVSLLLKTFGDSSMRIYHALLTKQRVLFVGYNHAASDVAQMVLSAVAMVCPPFGGLIRRTFPYATLFDLSFLEVKGYIAGVTNPMFQQRDTWWDLLCVLDLPNSTGQVFSAEDNRKAEEGPGAVASSSTAGNSAGSSSTKNASVSSKDPSDEQNSFLHGDKHFIGTVLSGIQAKLGENWTRQQFLDYTNMILQFAQDKGTLLNSSKLFDKAKRFYDANLHRMGLLESTTEYKAQPLYPWKWLSQENRSSDNSSTPPTPSLGGSDNAVTLPPIPNIDEVSVNETEGQQSKPATSTHSKDIDYILLKSYIRKLQYEMNIDSSELQTIYKHMESMLQSEADLQCLLILMPESMGGILPLASGLFHVLPSVKLYTTIIMSRIQDNPSTKAAFQVLNPLLTSAFERQRKRILDGSLQQEIHDSVKAKGNTESYSPLPGDMLANTLQSLSSFIQQTWTMIDDDDEDGDEDSGHHGNSASASVQPFSNTIDELDLIP